MNYKFGAILLLLLLPLWTGCFAPKTTPETAAPPPQSPPPPVCLDLVADDYPPFQYMEDGQLKGMAVDIIREALRRMDCTPNIRLYPWTRAVRMATDGEADGIFSIYKTAEREANTFHYPTESIFIDVQTFYTTVNNPAEYTGTLTSLEKYSVGAMRSYDYGDEFNTAAANHLINVEYVDKNTDNIDKLLGGRIQLFVDSRYVTLFHLKNRGLTSQIQPLQPPLRETALYLAFSRNRPLSPKYLERFSQVLSEMKKDGSYEAIVNRYIR